MPHANDSRRQVLQPEDDADQTAPMEPCPEAVPEAVPAAPAEMAERPSCASRSSESPQPREVAGTGRRTEKSGHGRISASGLRLRLWHKQPPPTGRVSEGFGLRAFSLALAVAGYVPPRRASRAKPKACLHQVYGYEVVSARPSGALVCTCKEARVSTRLRLLLLCSDAARSAPSVAPAESHSVAKMVGCRAAALTCLAIIISW